MYDKMLRERGFKVTTQRIFILEEITIILKIIEKKTLSIGLILIGKNNGVL